MELPKEFNVPSDNLGDYHIMISGEKNVGKTSLAAQFPDSLVIECEPGNARSLPVRYVDVGSWRDFLEVCAAIASQPDYCKTIVVDGLNTLYRYCQNHMCKSLGVEYPDDIPKGKGWNALGVEFDTKLKKLFALGKGVITTCHTRIGEYTMNNKKFHRIEQFLSTGAERFMNEEVQIIGVMRFGEEGERILTIQGSLSVKASHKLRGRFKDIVDIPMGKSPEEAYENFTKAFNNGI